MLYPERMTVSVSSTARSEQLFARAKAVTPGGVNSPVRAFKSVGGTPRFIQKAQGAYLTDVDGAEYIDYIGSWGPMILGHGHSAIHQAIAETLQEGTSFGAPNEREVLLAEQITQITNVDRVRFVNSGTEATMSALRLARGFTERKYIVKFRGNYHGHADGLLVEAGSGLLTNAEHATGELGVAAPSSAGVPEEYAALTLVLDYNDPDALDQLMKQRGDEIAAVIFEAVVGNAGLLIPTPEFRAALHRVREAGALLIADEVMTGFRLAAAGATQLLNLEPDLICWGKIIGGGLPVGAYGGRADVMDFVSPEGPVYQAGTLSGNPLAMAAGLATLQAIQADGGLYQRLDDYSSQLAAGLKEAAQKAGVPISVNHLGSMLTIFFQNVPDHSICTYAQAVECDTGRFAKWFQGMLDRGVYWAPSQFESVFVSAAHGQKELEHTVAAAEDAFMEIGS